MGESRIEFGFKWERSWTSVGMVLGAVCNGKKWGFSDGFKKLGLSDFKNLRYIQMIRNSLFFLVSIMPEPIC